MTCPLLQLRRARTVLAEPEEARASPQVTRQDRKRIKELERDLLHKDRVLAGNRGVVGTVKKIAAIFSTGEAA